MKFCVVASGSKGNMTYIETKEARILIDAGIALSDAQKRLPEINFSTITDIFITHEHNDHIRYLETIARKTRANIYMHKKTFESLPSKMKAELKKHKISFIEENGQYQLKDFNLLTLGLSHDTASNLGYVFSSEGTSLAYVTDTGFFPHQYIEAISNIDAIIIEANHSVEDLLNSNRHWTLKQRILSERGHLSNQDCFELLEVIGPSIHKYIILAHVSEDCNSDEALQAEVISKLAINFKGEILIARQREAIKIIEI
ncbi:MAG TPA: MBL fold metallo-hydrolase [Bacilli bacterium]|nr:MBL fold metallo-hydrolase [Bacilli bacterium]